MSERERTPRRDPRVTFDPPILGLAAMMPGLAGFVANVVPARTAAAIQPMQALRMD